MTTGVSVLNPLEDSRWVDFLERHPRASVFHSRGWLDALKRTYGYQPIVLTTTTGRGPLANGLALCRVKTWRSSGLVSLPFSDHCEPLFDRQGELSTVLGFVAEEMRNTRSSSLELRPRCTELTGLSESASYYLQTLNLARPAEQIFKEFHHSCTRRAIRRAEREGLTYEAGTSDRLLSSFYEMLRLTRRRHGMPPQPIAWFRNLIACQRGGVTIHVASKDGTPIASILTLSFKTTMVYKYGGSDSRHHRLGGMPFLFWRAIQDAKAQGIEELDLGRADIDQPGLVAFKDHLGATRTTLTYYNSPARRKATAHDGRISRAARQFVSRLPDAALDLTGRLLYRHLG
jgi:CelD/BcsL family acetyltransferase involved in cellulose biosynthesis